MQVKLSELPDNHLFVYSVYIWRKMTMDGNTGGIRILRTTKEILWIDIPPDTLVYPMVNAIKSEVSNGTNP